MFALLDRLDGGETVGLIAILAGAAVIALLIVVIGWGTTSAAKHHVALKRDMLARGMSVKEIEQLTMSEATRLAQLQSEQKVREAQIAADLRRDLLARGLPAEQVAQLAPSLAPGSDAAVLADTICSMGGGNLDRDAVARLIEAFLRRGAPPQPPATSDRILADDRAPLGRRSSDGA